MRLKNIKLAGFKSFAEEIRLDFNSGITGIIGPNGCGKSNISDGIRWVLGEQSSKILRGTKMDELIFSGSQTRRAPRPLQGRRSSRWRAVAAREISARATAGAVASGGQSGDLAPGE
ncbi:MAG: AAA family ATPase, partial [Spirochaetes bacterium]|nr:AAA family ATPase [Spirochaetota bacterium]